MQKIKIIKIEGVRDGIYDFIARAGSDFSIRMSSTTEVKEGQEMALTPEQMKQFPPEAFKDNEESIDQIFDRFEKTVKALAPMTAKFAFSCGYGERSNEVENLKNQAICHYFQMRDLEAHCQNQHLLIAKMQKKIKILEEREVKP